MKTTRVLRYKSPDAINEETGKRERIYKWIVEFTVDETWVQDGFDLDDERAKEMIEENIPYSYSSETTAKVIAAPSRLEIKKAQGGKA